MATLQINGTTIDHGADWDGFKNWLDGTYGALRYTWSDTGASYTIAALDGIAFHVVGINKVEPPSPAQIDFEANYKNNNAPFEPRSSEGGLLVAQSAYAYSPEPVQFVGFSYACPPGASTHEEEVVSPIRLQGGNYWASGQSVGDKVSLSVVDTNNVLGTGAGAVVSEYVKNLPVAPWNHVQEVSTSAAGFIPAGLFLRIQYQNTGSSNVDLGVTYRWFKAS